jgi:nitrate/nitrite transport system permease protein
MTPALSNQEPAMYSVVLEHDGAPDGAPATAAAPTPAADRSRIAAERGSPERGAPAAPRFASRIAPQRLVEQGIAPLFGLGLLAAAWAAVAARVPHFAGPRETLDAAIVLFADPFYANGPNDLGIGWNLLYSLERVGIGFGLAALVGIPAGFLIGRSRFAAAASAPVIGLLRPVSPLAWLPIGLLVFKAADPAAIWVIFICSIWPMVLNTAQGVRNVPQDYLDVARVLNLSEWKTATRILLPAVVPHILTGVRLAIGTAWLVIVAAEMLTGGVGIGFWVWDEWNNLSIPHILVAIAVIGAVGLLLEQALLRLARRLGHDAG